MARHAVGAGTDMVITLQWTPQRLVWIALVVIGMGAIVLCIACWPPWRHAGAAPGVETPWRCRLGRPASTGRADVWR